MDATEQFLRYHQTDTQAQEIFREALLQAKGKPFFLKMAIKSHLDDYFLERRDAPGYSYGHYLLRALTEIGIASLDFDYLHRSLMEVELLDPPNDLHLYAYAMLITTDWQESIPDNLPYAEKEARLRAMLMSFADRWIAERAVRDAHHTLATYGQVLFNEVWGALRWDRLLEQALS